MRLLDLPDEALELLERRELTEGHGRALLLNSDNSTRRLLARQAAEAGWSVRDLENRARSAGQAPAPRSRQESAVAHPDRVAAAERISDELGEALGADVKVRPSARGYTAQLRFGSLDEALELIDRLNS
jgi:ParB family transcriptional regulator, chromosome partitioning protein